MHWTRYRMKHVSFERACSIDDENHNARNFCWWIPYFCQLQSRQEECVRIRSATREQEMAASARQRRSMCDSTAVLGLWNLQMRACWLHEVILNRWNSIMTHNRHNHLVSAIKLHTCRWCGALHWRVSHKIYMSSPNQDQSWIINR